MKRLGSLSIQFYRILLLYNVAFTLTMLFIMVLYGFPVNASSLLFAKVVGFFTAIILHNYSSKQSYFYFRNAGYYMRWVFAVAFTLDMLIYLVTTLIGSLIFHIWQH